MPPSQLCVILGDQLSIDISSLKSADRQKSIILLAELLDETSYVKHHKKKIVLVLSAMRHFAKTLQEQGWTVRYVTLDDPENTHNFTDEVARAVADLGIDEIIITKAGEYRVQQQIDSWQTQMGCAVRCLQDDRFFATLDDFAHWADGRKQLRMEYFYRSMRLKYNVLMEAEHPVGGQWNYDHDNRKAPDRSISIPPHLQFTPDDITSDVITLVSNRFADHFGDIDPFFLAVTAEQAEQVLHHFIAERLVNFGQFQDAMLTDEPFMFHAHIGFYLNCGLLSPINAVRQAERAYFEANAPLNAVEGFIRQILGWREYVRGLYWYHMPDYKSLNFLSAERDLPAFFWHGQTDMFCLSQTIGQTKTYAYAHHIQRLMVIGNFALLAGLSPEQVNEWFMIVYADAYEWVELPNVSGMVLYADGGIMASKPYAAGGSYIDRMSDYCRSCRYKVKQKTGEDACPFNYLYWHFLDKHSALLSQNPRMGMMYRTWSKMAEERKNEIRNSANHFLNKLI